MATMTIERETIHKMIDELPQEREGILWNVHKILQEFDEEPLTDSELEQLEIADREIAAGEVHTFEEVWQMHLELP